MKRGFIAWQQELEGSVGRTLRLTGLLGVVFCASVIPVAMAAPAPPPLSGEAPAQTFAMAIPELEGPLTLGVFTPEGALVRLLYHDAPVESIPAGLNGLLVTWDGRDAMGVPVMPGTYRARGLVHGRIKDSLLPVHPSPLEFSGPEDARGEVASGQGTLSGMGTTQLPVRQPGEPPLLLPASELHLPAAADAIYERRPVVVLSVKLPFRGTNTVTLLVNGLPLLDLPAPPGVKSARISHGLSSGTVLLTLCGDQGEELHTVTGCDRLVPLEAGRLEIGEAPATPTDASLSPSETEESRE
jgi:hypothetical protein